MQHSGLAQAPQHHPVPGKDEYSQRQLFSNIMIDRETVKRTILFSGMSLPLFRRRHAWKITMGALDASRVLAFRVLLILPHQLKAWSDSGLDFREGFRGLQLGIQPGLLFLARRLFSFFSLGHLRGGLVCLSRRDCSEARAIV